jgi:hypothetical protein
MDDSFGGGFEDVDTSHHHVGRDMDNSYDTGGYDDNAGDW